MIQTGNFSSISDIVNIATAFILGELAEKTNPDFDYSVIVKDIPIDNSEKTKISVTISEYLDRELVNLAKVTQKNKSFIVRMALFRFFDFYNNTEKMEKQEVVPTDKVVVSKSELEDIVREMLNRILKEKQM
ncbi:MAG: hypothetical protein FWE54_01115 [Methanimicrococcus sp.]|nr:hypothetical protein [Methanimicrococcus sp.]